MTGITIDNECYVVIRRILVAKHWRDMDMLNMSISEAAQICAQALLTKNNGAHPYDPARGARGPYLSVVIFSTMKNLLKSNLSRPNLIPISSMRSEDEDGTDLQWLDEFKGTSEEMPYDFLLDMQKLIGNDDPLQRLFALLWQGFTIDAAMKKARIKKQYRKIKLAKLKAIITMYIQE